MHTAIRVKVLEVWFRSWNSLLMVQMYKRWLLPKCKATPMPLALDLRKEYIFLIICRSLRQRFIFGSNYIIPNVWIILYMSGSWLHTSEATCNLPKEKGSVLHWKDISGSQNGWGSWVTSPRKQAETSGGESAGNPAKEVTQEYYLQPQPLVSPLHSHCCECSLKGLVSLHHHSLHNHHSQLEASHWLGLEAGQGMPGLFWRQTLWHQDLPKIDFPLNRNEI